MLDSNNKLNLLETFNQVQNFQESAPEIIYENPNILLTHNSTGEERYFINTNSLGNFSKIKTEKPKKHKRKEKKPHTKYSYDNLKRECKHLVIENVMDFINEKINIAYDGNIGSGLFKKQLMKLNQEQKKNSNIEFNQIFMTKTLKEILSQNITKRIKFYKEDHNKVLIKKLIEEKKDEFESLFNLTFIDCLEHFIGNKTIIELDGMTLFNEVKNSILEKYENDGESYYQNLELFMKDFKDIINNAKPRKRKENL